MLVGKPDADPTELLTGALSLLSLLTEPLPLLLLVGPELELLEAMWNGNEYWKVEGSESRVIFKP